MTEYIRIHQPSDAELYRRAQAEALLREAGFVRHADGTWHPGPESTQPSPAVN